MKSWILLCLLIVLLLLLMLSLATSLVYFIFDACAIDALQDAVLFAEIVGDFGFKISALIPEYGLWCTVFCVQILFQIVVSDL